MPHPAPQPLNPQTTGDLTGKTVGRFVVESRLGAGGMGEVYRAEDPRLKRPVALKRMAPRLQSDPAFRQRFLREAQVASGLPHQHIAGVYDVLETHDEVFVVMEFVEGVTLRHRLAEPISLEDFLAIGVQCVEALVAAHARGIVHRDVKPENIMLTPAGQVKILDFGVAKQLPRTDDAVTLDTRAVLDEASASFGGTLAYMAPEALLEKETDHRADLFSLGVVFFEALAGRHPFRAESFLATTTRILHEEPAPLRQFNPRVPAELERIVAKMLAKSPADRYATAADLLVDLRSVQRAWSASTRSRETVGAPSVRRAGRAKWPWIAAAAAVVVLAAVAVNLNGVRDRILGRTVPGRIESIAVLPLENLSHDAEQEYFADGMTDALITELSSVGALRVVSRTSVMRYKDTRKPVPEVAKELRVDAVIAGTVLRSADRVRISAVLVHAGTDRQLWAKSYERDLRDVLTLQSQLAHTITEEINVKLTTREQSRLATPGRAVNPEAYEAYLHGRYHLNKRTPEGFQEALHYFQRAIEKDPSYAPAYAGLADAYALLGDYEVLPPREAMPKAKEAALKALAFDPALAEAHASLANIRLSYLEFDGVEDEFARAIELNPGYAAARHWHALYLSAMGRHDEAIAEIKRARELDPFSLIVNANVGWCYYLARRYEDAIREAQRTLELDPGFAIAHEYLGQAYLEQGRHADALAELDAALALSPRNASYKAELGNALATVGRRREARKLLEELKALSKQKYVSPYDLALLIVGLDSRDEAFRWLEKAFEERNARLQNLNVHPRFDKLRSDPRFSSLLGRIGFSANKRAEWRAPLLREVHLRHSVQDGPRTRRRITAPTLSGRAPTPAA